MAVTTALFNSFKKKIMDGSIDLDTDTIKVALCTSGFTPNIDTMDFFDDITNEVIGTGYTAGGATLANKTITVDTTNDRAYLDADDTTWTSSTITARYIIVYKSTGTAATSPLIGYINLGADRSSSSDTFYISWPAPASGGVLYLA
jgi:hypothetical protein